MTATASTTLSKLDIEKFRKVRALMQQGVTEGERQAATSRATKMAEMAAMSLSEAMAEADAEAARTTSRPSFFDFFDTPFFREQKEKREIKRAALRRAALDEYGSEEAVFAETVQEAALSEATEPFKEWEEYVNSLTGKPGRYVSSLDGWNGETSAQSASHHLRQAVQDAYPISENLGEVLAEYEYWSKLGFDRRLFEEDYNEELWVDVRIDVLAQILDKRPVQNWADMDARLGWWQVFLDDGTQNPDGWEQALKDRIAEDHRILRDMSKLDVQTGHSGEERRTNAKKAADVAEMIRRNPDLSSREIARKLGISPQTVATWRKKLAGGPG